MNFRQRLVAAALWIGVAALMAITLEPGLPTSVDAVARLFVVVTALALAAVYVYDPWDVISRYHA
ncbi:hypothetical protein [Natrinema salifodinae]|uniref:Uncharacterized protein n=1 Tax=Natrinema salifodinae TaxID=1202768 RepID=A0A1I0M5G1_9EURY|nr:hypothetical protein [Natrinema salifodinae]SEV83707.1 hypothetical protein SAMN05216285_0520 [Natrinema salifodinae]